MTSGELSLLRAFLDNPNRVLYRHELLALTRQDDAAVFDRTVDVLVSRLRRKLEPDPGSPQFIQTVRGEGYLFTQTVDWSVA
jgi:two-component system OmpR family response regulator